MQDVDASKTACIFRAIDGIAFQASLLALNAAVETAEVQEAGSGTVQGLAAGEAVSSLSSDRHTAVHRLAFLSAGVSVLKQ